MILRVRRRGIFSGMRRRCWVIRLRRLEKGSSPRGSNQIVPCGLLGLIVYIFGICSWCIGFMTGYGRIVYEASVTIASNISEFHSKCVSPAQTHDISPECKELGRLD